MKWRWLSRSFSEKNRVVPGTKVFRRVKIVLKWEVAQVRWEDVREAFPQQWVLIEAVKAYTNDKSERILEEVVPIKRFSNSPEAMRAYQTFHQENPTRELYVLHTNRKEPNIIEKKWVGVRR